jgi:putative flavoprotein involved in K+ transport
LDIFWWLANTGRLARTIDTMPDASAARRESSLQLVGRLTAENLDLGVLLAQGVRLTGRLERVTGGRAWFRNDLAETIATADRRMHRFLDAADAHVQDLHPARRPRPIDVPPAPACLDLRAERIGTILLAVGYRPHFPWLKLPVLTPDGAIEQYRGATAAPGVYVVGQPFQHRRDSGYVAGACHDAAAVVGHLLSRDGRPVTWRPVREEPAA